MDYSQNRWLNGLVILSFWIASPMLTTGLVLVIFTDYDKQGNWLLSGSATLFVLAVALSSFINVAEKKERRRAKMASYENIACGKRPLTESDEFRRRQEEVNNDQWLHADAPPTNKPGEGGLWIK